MTSTEEMVDDALRRAKQPVTLDIIRASDVTAKAIEWFWPNRFALGKLGLLAGLPDRGKGLIICDLAARATNKGLNDLPCGEGTVPYGSVVILSDEDDPDDTTVPRLIAAGADLTKIHFVKMARQGNSKRTFNLLTDLEALRAAIEEIGDVVLVVIDPLTSYLGVGKVNTFQGGDVRGVLMPLVELAPRSISPPSVSCTSTKKAK